MTDFPWRTDEYGRNFYITKNGKTDLIPYRTGRFSKQGIDFLVSEEILDNVLKISIEISANKSVSVDCFGFRLGIDTYMDKYPQWNSKFFPTALRCEKNGFWSCFMTPEGKMLSVCSPSKIISWKNEYNRAGSDVGHRIYTSSVEFINTNKQPERHPENSICEISQEPLKYELYYSHIPDEKSLFEFVYKYTGIHVPSVNKFTLEQGEKLYIDTKEYNGNLSEGINFINIPGNAELSVYVRKDWFYYIYCAQKSALKCQQKPGTHCESWYGYFTMAEYAKIIKDAEYTKTLCAQFDSFFKTITKGIKHKKLKAKALPHRLQNASAMISLLADFYELTGNENILIMLTIWQNGS